MENIIKIVAKSGTGNVGMGMGMVPTVVYGISAPLESVQQKHLFLNIAGIAKDSTVLISQFHVLPKLPLNHFQGQVNKIKSHTFFRSHRSF